MQHRDKGFTQHQIHDTITWRGLIRRWHNESVAHNDDDDRPVVRDGRFCVNMRDETQGFQDPSVSRPSPSNLNTPIRTAAITASRLELTSSFRRKFVE